MALDDIYRVRLIQAYGTSGQQSINVFHYKQVFEVDPSGDAAELLVNFRDNVETLIRDCQTANISTLQIAVENVVPGTDNAYESFALNTRFGDHADQALPPFACYAFRLNRTSSAVRNGQKRFWGIPETHQVDGVINATGLGFTVPLAAALGADLGGIPTFNTFRPIIYRIAREEVTIPAKTIPALAAANFPISSAAYISISTQNSRKFGTG